jgi:hypothetical protein
MLPHNGNITLHFFEVNVAFAILCVFRIVAKKYE